MNSELAFIYNLSQIITFHNDLRSCMKDAWANMRDGWAKNDELNSLEAKLWESRWKNYDTWHRINIFLMVCAYTEEWLCLFSKKYYSRINIPIRGGIFSRYEPVLRTSGIDLSQCCEWDLLTDCEKIRNCLLHANGRVDLMRKKRSETEKAAERRGVNIELNRLRIPSDFLNSFVEKIKAFITKLYEQERDRRGVYPATIPPI